ncbi:unnamed protein product [Adineta ricciae]|uniref:Uncharacterized protein n=1 Tax=Adineta ricciae TaxID=249248 RepID=A0A813MYY5_ADIRI|nr:unnamed protein product [Adineta ricciae]
MSSANYLLTETNETISWIYDRFLSNASIEKKDLSLLGFITGICNLAILLASLIYRIDLYARKRLKSKETFFDSPSASSVTTATNDITSEFS